MPNWYIAADGLQARTITSTAGEKLSFVGPFETYRKWKRFPSDLYNPYTTEKRLELGFVKDDSKKKSKTNIVKVKKLSNIWLVSMVVKIKFTEKYIETSFRIELTRVLEDVLQ